MVSKSPWSVKGVEPEAREAAKIAARRASLTVGEWLSHTIRSAAARQLSGARNMGERGVGERGMGESADGYGPFNGDADTGLGGASPGPSDIPGTAHPPAPTIQALFNSIQKLTNRVEQAEMKTTAAVAPLVEQVENLSSQLEDVKSQNTVSTAPVERAVTRLSERLEEIEERTTGNRRKSRGWWPFGRN